MSEPINYTNFRARRRRGKAYEDRRMSIAGVTHPTPAIHQMFMNSLAAFDALPREIRRLIHVFDIKVYKLYSQGHRDPESIRDIMRNNGVPVEMMEKFDGHE